LRPNRTNLQVTEEIARHFAKLAARLAGRGATSGQAAHFLTQLLFCLFAEDIGLLERKVFTEIVERSLDYPERFRRHCDALFGAMNAGGEFYLYEIPHFNGGLFADVQALDLDRADLELLLSLARRDWGAIDPTIMGTLFERSIDPEKRGQLGMHYTHPKDILHIVHTVMIAPLRREWDALRAQIDPLCKAEPMPASTEHERGKRRLARRRQHSFLADSLLRFKARLASVRVLDPAAGSGNFLAVGLQELLALEKEVINYGVLAGLSSMFPDVSPGQFYGIEINPYGYKLAQVSIWIAYLQWMYANGFQPRRDPILQSLDTITHGDAILDISQAGLAREVCWPNADYIVGNPPFLGGNKIRQGLGDEYTDALFEVYAGRVPAFADLVCYWFEKARAQIQVGATRRAGLLSTNSIRGGVNRRVLERIKEAGDIFMALADKPWVLDGAAVRVSIVAFDNGEEPVRVLNNLISPEINADLTARIDLTHAATLAENRNISFQGPSPKGAFDVPSELAALMLRDGGNPNGRPNSDVVKRVVNAADIVRRNRGYWTIDFGPFIPLTEAMLYEKPFEYIREHVYPERAKNNRAAYREKWWVYAEARTGMRQALKGLPRYIATPRVAKHRVFTWLGAGNDPRYTPTTCFETFPFPWASNREPRDNPCAQAIAAAARTLTELRDRWLNPPGTTEAESKTRTLTNLYNARPTWLAAAHDKLDRAVLDAYGWSHDLSDDDLLAQLLALNFEREWSTTAKGALPSTRVRVAAD